MEISGYIIFVVESMRPRSVRMALARASIDWSTMLAVGCYLSIASLVLWRKGPSLAATRCSAGAEPVPLTCANWRDEIVLSDLPEPPAQLCCEGLTAEADWDRDWLAEYETDCDLE